jgi:small GTP-binding protein
MIQKKICMVGSFGVGKTSLVARFVQSIFSETYLTTVGVKIDKKQLSIDGRDVTLMLWDLAGKDAVTTIKPEHLRGASGYLVVADGTRAETLQAALDIQSIASSATGDPPFTLVINKADLRSQWEIDDRGLEPLQAKGWPIVLASAKTGDSVESLFEDLAIRILRKADGGEQSAAAPAR